MRNILFFILFIVPKFVVAQVGIGTENPTKTLDVNGEVRVRQIEEIDQNSLKYALVTDDEGVINKIEYRELLGLPKTTVYILANDLNGFLSTASTGNSQPLPLSVAAETTSAVYYDYNHDEVSKRPIIFKKGYHYTVTIAMEATHDAEGCTVSSYFVDFPTGTYSIKEGRFDRTRNYMNASHNQGVYSEHGGTLTYSFLPAQDVYWVPHIGRADSGNCFGNGMVLKSNSTMISIISFSKE